MKDGRISVFLHGLYGGGVERTMLNLVQGIGDRGYSVDLVLARATGPLLSQIPKQVRMIDLSSSRVLLSLPSLVSYLRNERPIALLSAIDYTNVIALWARRLAAIPCRVVIAEHSTFSMRSQKMAGGYGNILKWLLGHFYPWADRVVAVSKGVADDLAATIGIPRNRIRVIYNPVITQELQQKLEEPFTHPWLTPKNAPVILAVGRLTEAKDFETLILAFKQVHAGRPVRLIILGEGESRPELEALIQRLGIQEDVNLPGFISNPYPYMKNASLFALSSKREGLPTVLIEALYCGLPIVSTDCPSGPREILKDGEHGHLVPVGNVNAFAQAINLMLDSKSRHLPDEGWSAYDLNTVVDQYLDVLLNN